MRSEDDQRPSQRSKAYKFVRIYRAGICEFVARYCAWIAQASLIIRAVDGTSKVKIMVERKNNFDISV